MVRAFVLSGRAALLAAVLICSLPVAQADLHWQSAGGPPGATTYVVTQDAWGRIYVGTSGMGVYRSSDGGTTWTHLGFRGCTVYDVKANPNDPTMLAVGCEFDQRGLFISRDDGIGWESCPLNARIGPCIQVAFDPVDPEWLYAGFMSDSLYYSTDRGLHWQVFPYSFMKIVGGMQVGYAPARIYTDPSDSDRLLVGTGLELHYIQPGGGFYISEDRGLTWQEVLIQGSAAVPLAVDFAPGNPQRLVGSFEDFGICRSLDGGWSWTPVATMYLFADLHFDPLATNHLWACSVSGCSFPPGAYESLDGGTSWICQATGLLGTGYWNTLVCDGPNVYLGEWGTGLYKWSAAESRWHEINAGLQNTSVHDALEVRLSGGAREEIVTVAATYENGVFVGDPLLGSWTRANEGLDTGDGIETFCLSLAADPQGTLFLGTEGRVNHYNIYRSRNGAASWEPVKASGFSSMAEEITCLAISPSNPNVIFATRGGGSTAGTYRSLDGGDTWSFRTFGIGAGGSYDVEPHPLQPAVVYGCGWPGFVVSTNGGDSFQRVPGFSTSLLAIRDVAFDPQDPQRMWVSTQYNGLYRSTNGGSLWEAVTSFQAPTNHWPVSILVDPLDSHHVLVATDRISGEVQASGIYETRDDGVTWQLANDGLHWLSARKLRLGVQPHVLQANAADGVWTAAWGASAVAEGEPGSGGQPGRSGGSALVPRANGHFAGAELGLTAWPNPARGHVQVALDLPQSGLVELSLFGAGGRCVRHLARQPIDRGGYTLEWDGGGPGGRRIPPGTYYLRLKCGEETRVQRLLLLGEF